MQKGKFIFYYGCMGSGKSLHLLATAHNFQEHEIPFIIFKSCVDTRDGENVIFSRALGSQRECVTLKQNDNIFSLVKTYSEISSDELKWILIDEAQFLTEKQVEELAAICDMLGIGVMCFGLRTDFKTKLFPASKRLFELADEFEEIKSSCFCGNKTIVNARVNDNGEIVTDGEQVEVGGDDRYVSLCRKCYFERSENPLYNKNLID